MLSLIARVATIVALCFAIGLHWIALQSIAWTAMMIQNAKSTSICRAVEQTLDGAHPCSLCHAVSKGKASEQKRDVQTTMAKIDIACVSRVIRLLPRLMQFEYTAKSVRFSEAQYAPPVPPPRASLG